MLELKLRQIDAMSFCKKLNKLKSSFDVHSRRIIVDGKSIIGLCSVDYTNPLYLDCILEDGEDLEYIKEHLKDYLK